LIFLARFEVFAVVFLKRRVSSDVGPVIVGRVVLDLWKNSSVSFFSFQQSKKERFSFCIARGATRGRNELSIKKMKSAVMSILLK
jgi:hypothetical protein